MKMKALVYKGPGDIKLEEMAVLEVGEQDVLIKNLYCGVCGTDIHIYHGDGGAFDVKPSLIMGHEFSGIVEAVGAKVTKVAVGDLVSVDPNEFCGECYYCDNKMEQFCKHVKGIGTTENGGFAQYSVIREKQVFKFEKGIDPKAAAMAEPISCCLHGIDLCNIQLGDTVLILGGGPIGLLMLQMAKLTGASQVILSEPVEAKRILAKQLGADIVINPFVEDVESIVKESCKNVDVVIECIGKVQTIEMAIHLAGNGSRVMLFGLTNPDEVIHVKPDELFKKEIKLMSSFINPYTFQRAVALIESKRIDTKAIIGEILSLENGIEVFENDEYRSKGKILIHM